jgi:hypothetical protein
MNNKPQRINDLLILVSISGLSIVIYKAIKSFIFYVILIGFFSELKTISSLSLFIVSSFILAILSIITVIVFYILLRKQRNKYLKSFPLLFSVGLFLLESLIYIVISIIQNEEMNLKSFSPNLDFVVPLLFFCYLYFLKPK